MSLPGRPWTYQPLPSARDFHLEVVKKFKGFSGPVGSGKSFAFCYEALFLASLWNPGLLGLIGAPTYRMLRDATKRTFVEILELEEISYTSHKSENKITLLDTGSEIIFRSLDNYENLRGPNLAWFGVDELTYCPPEAWSRLEARLRHPAAQRLCGFAAWTPKGFDHVWEKFIDQPNKDYFAVRARPRENVYVERTGFYDRLAASYDERFFRQEVLGEYLALSTGAVYYAFDRSKNVSADVVYDPLLPVCWALDFNVNPMCSVICQMDGRSTYSDQLRGDRRVKVNVLDEIVLPDSNTMEMCAEFERRLAELTRRAWNVNLRVYGDPAGAARSTTGKSDWLIVREHLGRIPGLQVSYHVPSAHPAVKDRTNAVNGMLCSSTGDRRLFLSPSCRELVRDFEQVVWKNDKGGNSTGAIDKSDGQRTHVSDALGYLIAQEFGLQSNSGYRSERLF